MGFFGGVASALDWFEDTSPNIISSGASVVVTANAAAHTKGNWVQLIASSSGNTSFTCFSAAGIGAATTNTATPWIGDLLALFSAILYACYSVTTALVLKKRDSIESP